MRSSSRKSRHGIAGRPAVKRNEILKYLHDQIISGQLCPHSKLPTRRDLQVQFQTSLAIIQQALDQLSNEGFIEAHGRLGTFVTAMPPHKARYGIVTPMYPYDPGYSQFWTALVNESMRARETMDKTFRVYQGVERLTGAPDYQSLLDDVQRHRLAGLIFTSSPFFLENTPILENPGIPCVTIGSKTNNLHRNITPVICDSNSFAEKAIDYLAQRGRKRIALLSPPGHEAYAMKNYAACLAKHDLQVVNYLKLEVDIRSPVTARNLTHILLRLPPNERPDSLVISDDNLVEQATAGIFDAGIRVPEDLDVVAHCNFPWPTPSVVPVRRLGYDAREIIHTAIRIIDQKLADNSTPIVTQIPARFEDELLADPITHVVDENELPANR